MLPLHLLNLLQKFPDDYVTINMYTPTSLEIEEFSKSKYRKFYKSKESLRNMYSSLWYLKSFPYKEHFNRKITLTHAMGMGKAADAMFDVPRQIKWDKYQHINQESGLLQFDHLFGVFIFFLSGCCASIIVLGLEVVCVRIKKLQKYRKERKDLAAPGVN